jgi:hypothetical protein
LEQLDFEQRQELVFEALNKTKKLQVAFFPAPSKRLFGRRTSSGKP